MQDHYYLANLKHNGTLAILSRNQVLPLDALSKNVMCLKCFEAFPLDSLTEHLY